MRRLSLSLFVFMMMVGSYLIPVENVFAASKPYLLIKEKNVVMDEGSKKQLSVSSNAKITGITWRSSNSSIVSIDSKGVISGKKAGAITITASDKKLKLSATAKVTVKAKVINITRITPSEKSVVLTEDESTQVTVTIQPSNATNKSLIWSSSSPENASVEQDGTIYAHKKGTARITISNASKSINAIISVKVEAIPEENPVPPVPPVTPIPPVTPVPPSPPVPTTQEIIKDVSKSVVYIEAYSNGTAIASGSGFILTADGNIATNFHVITDDQSPIDTVKIKLQDGSMYSTTKVIGYDKGNDLAILKLDNVSGLKPVKLGDSKNIVTGDKIITIGSPMGLDNTVSEGIISNIERVLDGVPYIQITAPISHGSSGGVLINEKGEVIGVTSAGIEEGQNLNFALPINLLKSVVIGNGVSITSLQTPKISDLLPGQSTIYEDEINDLPYQANIIQNVKFNIIGSIYDENDEDFYKFTITKPRQFILLTAMESRYSYLTSDLLVGIFDTNDKLVYAGTSFYGPDGTLYKKIDYILQPGTYYLYFTGSENTSPYFWNLHPTYLVAGGFLE